MIDFDASRSERALRVMTLGVTANAWSVRVMTLGASASASAVLVMTLGCQAVAAAIAGSGALACCKCV